MPALRIIPAVAVALGCANAIRIGDPGDDDSYTVDVMDSADTMEDTSSSKSASEQKAPELASNSLVDEEDDGEGFKTLAEMHADVSEGGSGADEEQSNDSEELGAKRAASTADMITEEDFEKLAAAIETSHKARRSEPDRGFGDVGEATGPADSLDDSAMLDGSSSDVTVDETDTVDGQESKPATASSKNADPTDTMDDMATVAGEKKDDDKAKDKKEDKKEDDKDKDDKDKDKKSMLQGKRVDKADKQSKVKKSAEKKKKQPEEDDVDSMLQEKKADEEADMVDDDDMKMVGEPSNPLEGFKTFSGAPLEAQGQKSKTTPFDEDDDEVPMVLKKTKKEEFNGMLQGQRADEANDLDDDEWFTSEVGSSEADAKKNEMEALDPTLDDVIDDDSLRAEAEGEKNDGEDLDTLIAGIEDPYTAPAAAGPKGKSMLQGKKAQQADGATKKAEDTSQASKKMAKVAQKKEEKKAAETSSASKGDDVLLDEAISSLNRMANKEEATKNIVAQLNKIRSSRSKAKDAKKDAANDNTEEETDLMEEESPIPDSTEEPIVLDDTDDAPMEKKANKAAKQTPKQEPRKSFDATSDVF
eukprot:TRINITY_DN518_c0_g1_i1.p1 TRINITY_DN518_c0_g1~~TRINITY_DN518_c0_g1_i1.p1  ORF type:complete len:588 (+),score=259.43 TRINITY_DN518_c0_g1_i1:86-1849(+)